MRKRGLSYSEIRHAIHVPKSTIASWLREVKLSPEQLERLQKKRDKVARANAQKKVSQTSKAIEQIHAESARAIGKISKRELWLIGIILYGKDSHRTNDKNGVQYTSGNPLLINLFLKWLKEVGGITEGEIGFDIFIAKNQKDQIHNAVKYWSDITGFRPVQFTTAYYLKPYHRKTKKQISTQAEFGYLKIRVKESSLLARQINGWIKGILTSLSIGEED